METTDPVADSVVVGRPVSPAYVVLAYRNPFQVRALIDAVAPWPVYLHIDTATDAAVRAAMVSDLPARVRLFSGHRTRWAGWGCAAAFLEGATAAIRGGATHVVQASGQCLPLVSQREVVDLLAEDPTRIYYSSRALPIPHLGRDGGLYRFRGWHRSFRQRRLTIPVPRSWPGDLAPWHSSAYGILTAAAVDVLKTFVRERRRESRLFEHVWAPDEHFIATVLMNSHLSDRVARDNLWYIDWSNADSRHPRTLGDGDIAALGTAADGPSTVGGWARRKFFARKFDVTAGSAVLESLRDRWDAPADAPTPGTDQSTPAVQSINRQWRRGDEPGG
jgi:hypothetical protein